MDFGFDAMTAGVKPGGLNSKHTIRVLLCYVINSVNKPITQEQLHRAIVATELANLFEFGDALSRLELGNLINKDEVGGYTITNDGKTVAETLHTEIPITVREQAYNAAINCLEYSKLLKDSVVDIKRTQNGDYAVSCKLFDNDNEIMSLTLGVAEPELAEYIKKRIFNNSKKLYSCMLAALTGSPGLFKEAVEKLNEADILLGDEYE